jgi:uncharacterized protein YjiS (DUF1127 family)
MANYGVQNFDRPVEARNEFADLPGYDRLSIENKARLAQAQAIANTIISLTNAIGEAAAWLYAPIKRWLAERAVRDELMGLDERTLADIGLTRGDIPQVAAGLWVPENRSTQKSWSAPKSATNVNNKPQIAA